MLNGHIIVNDVAFSKKRLHHHRSHVLVFRSPTLCSSFYRTIIVKVFFPFLLTKSLSMFIRISMHLICWNMCSWSTQNALWIFSCMFFGPLWVWWVKLVVGTWWSMVLLLRFKMCPKWKCKSISPHYAFNYVLFLCSSIK